jgi:putative ABC transport system substrate-binding protein
MLCIRRREFVTLLGGAVAWPIALDAKSAGRLWHVGFIAGGSRPVPLESTTYGDFSRGMRELGYVEGRDFVIDWRFAEGRYELFAEFARELVRLNVDVIILGTAEAISVAQQATNTIPIVMAASTDPVGYGYITSLARPGGNVTGLASSHDDIAPKQLDILATFVPGLRRIGLLINPNNPAHPLILRVINAAARRADVEIVPAEMARSEDLERAFVILNKEQVKAVLIPGDSLFFSQRARIAQTALASRLPTMFARREYAEAGGLISYGESLTDSYRHAAFYVDRIFKGEKPADLPVQQPTKFYTVINRKTAEILGLTIPLQLLVLSDEVIE